MLKLEEIKRVHLVSNLYEMEIQKEIISIQQVKKNNLIAFKIRKN